MPTLEPIASPPSGRDTPPDPIYLWAKLSKHDTGRGYHPVLCHLIDVAAVAHALWRLVLTPGERDAIAATLGVDTERAGRWIAFWAGLHDLGKISPAFQAQNGTARQWVEAAGFPFPRPPRPAPHGTITAVTLDDALAGFGLPYELIDNLRISIGGHHGAFPHVGDRPDRAKSVGGGYWSLAREQVAMDLADCFDIRPNDGPLQLPATTAIWLAGFVSIADWIGSNDDYFPYNMADPDGAPQIPRDAYHVSAKNKAERALDHLGWTSWTGPSTVRSIRDLFPFIEHPHQVQLAAERLATSVTDPCLIVIEAPMGEGKTEAAFFLADYWSASSRPRGTYIALPTRATSDQIFSRFREFLARRFPGEQINLQLLHGHAALSAEFEILRQRERRDFAPNQVFDDDAMASPAIDAELGAVAAAEWFTYRKRGLLAPFGVGTIDQALLAVLQTRHYFVRLFGLSSKTVIIDEVHAYDAYMSTLLERLLEWLAVLGSPVILLSATLPAERRSALLEAYARGLDRPSIAVPEVPYPRLSWVDRDAEGARHVDASTLSTKQVQITWLTSTGDRQAALSSLSQRLHTEINQGGCAVVVCNTVRRAQETFLALSQQMQGLADDGFPLLDLLHARYLARDRQQREWRTLRRFGKAGTVVEGEEVRRPHRAVLVATQIVEQSLDLDFDLLVTDIAPADLVLQRIGRLHRHRDRERYGLCEPKVWIIPAEERNGVPAFDEGSSAVYDSHILLRSWLALKDRDVLTIPDDVETLIAAVYDDQPCPAGASAAIQNAWDTTFSTMMTRRDRDQFLARNRRILSPTSPDNLLGDRNQALSEEDDPAIHQSVQALTRLGDPTVNVVCLTLAERTDFRSSERPSTRRAAWLLQRSVAIGNRRIIGHLLALPIPSGWQRSPLLRYHRLLELDANGACQIGQHRLRLDRELGVVIE